MIGGEAQALATQAKVSYKERQRQAREEAILDAAQELFAAHGYLATTLDSVVAAVGISLPTLYLHFRSKEELAVRVSARTVGDIRRHLEELSGAGNPDETLRRMVEWMLRRRFDPRQARQFDMTAMPFVWAHPLVRAEEEGIAEAFHGVLAEGQRRGLVRGGVSPIVLGQLMNSVPRDAAYELLIASGRIDLDTLVESVLCLVLLDTCA